MSDQSLPRRPLLQPIVVLDVDVASRNVRDLLTLGEDIFERGLSQKRKVSDNSFEKTYRGLGALKRLE